VQAHESLRMLAKLSSNTVRRMVTSSTHTSLTEDKLQSAGPSATSCAPRASPHATRDRARRHRPNASKSGTGTAQPADEYGYGPSWARRVSNLRPLACEAPRNQPRYIDIADLQGKTSARAKGQRRANPVPAGFCREFGTRLSQTRRALGAVPRGRFVRRQTNGLDGLSPGAGGPYGSAGDIDVEMSRVRPRRVDQVARRRGAARRPAVPPVKRSPGCV